MKKILLIPILLFLTGCYNYIEINNLVIVSGIAIDYKDSKYNICFEALYQDKEKSDSKFEKGNVTCVEGITIADAFSNYEKGLSKKPFFAHLKLLIISDSIAKDRLKNVIEFILRNNEIRNNFYVTVTNDNIHEILSMQTNYNPVVSEYIKNIIESKKYRNNISSGILFKNIAKKFLSKKENIILSSINKSDDNIFISGSAIFDDKGLKNYLSISESETLNIMLNKKPYIIVKNKCDDDKYISFEIYKNNQKSVIQKDLFTLNFDMDAEILENECNINLENKKDNKKITNDLENKLNNDFLKIINKLKNYNCDILGINNKYYIKQKDFRKKYFKNTNYEINVKIDINKKGQTFVINNYDK